MPIFTLNIQEPAMATVRRLARELDVAEVDVVKLLFSEGARHARAVQEEEDHCPLDRLPAMMGEEVPA